MTHNEKPVFEKKKKIQKNKVYSNCKARVSVSRHSAILDNYTGQAYKVERQHCDKIDTHLRKQGASIIILIRD